MKNKWSPAEIVLVLGLVGIFGVLMTMISDLILLGRPDSARSFFRLGTESMADIPQWRITSGTFIGVFMLPFQLAGLATLYQGLKPSGRLLPALIVLTDAHALIMGVAFHASYAYIANGWKLLYALEPGNLHSAEIVQRFGSYWTLIVAIMMIELTAGSIAYVVLVLKGRSLYPKWMALLNPLFVLGGLFLVVPYIPAPVGGYVGPMILNMTTFVFFLLSTVLIHRKLKQQEVLHPTQGVEIAL